eukprot:gb/GECG01000514.1/.p1 GENE.gb/GECG01000514.1/~~gb/GECG01000514.1/.p1  ORF type:complete len:417 (+),score=52.60 gb/GECG01000514.1/:1-1251(+)
MTSSPWCRGLQRRIQYHRRFFNATPLRFSCTLQAHMSDVPGVYADDSIAFPVESATAGKDLLEYGPRGVYTTARTVRHDRVFQFDKQVNRLVESAALMILDDEFKDGILSEDKVPHTTEEKIAHVRAHVPRGDETLDRTQMTERMKFICKTAIDLLDTSRTDWKEQDLKITLLYSWQPLLSKVEPQHYPKLPQPQQHSQREEIRGHYATSFGKNHTALMCYVTRLPVRPETQVKTVVRGTPRSNAAAKDSAWVHTRRELEKKMSEDMEETLLIEFSSGRLMEGLQTNFMAIIDGVLYTAGDNVLNGTVRQLVLEECDANGIPYKLEGPLLSQAHLWEAAFITSTSRLILPVDELHIPQDVAANFSGGLIDVSTRNNAGKTEDGSLTLSFRSSECALLSRLSRLVRNAVEEHSSPLR